MGAPGPHGAAAGSDSTYGVAILQALCDLLQHGGGAVDSDGRSHGAVTHSNQHHSRGSSTGHGSKASGAHSARRASVTSTATPARRSGTGRHPASRASRPSSAVQSRRDVSTRSPSPTKSAAHSAHKAHRRNHRDPVDDDDEGDNGGVDRAAGTLPSQPFARAPAAAHDDDDDDEYGTTLARHGAATAARPQPTDRGHVDGDCLVADGGPRHRRRSSDAPPLPTAQQPAFPPHTTDATLEAAPAPVAPSSVGTTGATEQHFAINGVSLASIAQLAARTCCSGDPLAPASVVAVPTIARTAPLVPTDAVLSPLPISPTRDATAPHPGSSHGRATRADSGDEVDIAVYANALASDLLRQAVELCDIPGTAGAKPTTTAAPASHTRPVGDRSARDDGVTQPPSTAAALGTVAPAAVDDTIVAAVETVGVASAVEGEGGRGGGAAVAEDSTAVASPRLAVASPRARCTVLLDKIQFTPSFRAAFSSDELFDSTMDEVGRHLLRALVCMCV